MFIEARSPQPIVPALKANLSQLKSFKKLGLFTTVQHIGQLSAAQSFLEENGVEVLIQKSQKPTSSQGICSKYSGQVLGCDATAIRKMNADAFIYIGTGEFHPIAIALETEKPVFKLNPFTNQLSKVDEKDKRKWLAKQAARLDKLNRSKKVGIIVSTKPGQYKPNLAKKLEKKFPNAYMFIGDTVTPQALLDFPDIDAWINTACPRLVEDSWSRPFVNASEVL